MPPPGHDASPLRRHAIIFSPPAAAFIAPLSRFHAIYFRHYFRHFRHYAILIISH
jgi:hypothetical protein